MDSTLEITQSAQPACTRVTAWFAVIVLCPVCHCVCVCLTIGIFEHLYLFWDCSNMFMCIHWFFFLKFQYTCVNQRSFSVQFMSCVLVCMWVSFSHGPGFTSKIIFHQSLDGCVYKVYFFFFFYSSYRFTPTNNNYVAQKGSFLIYFFFLV